MKQSIVSFVYDGPAASTVIVIARGILLAIGSPYMQESQCRVQFVSDEMTKTLIQRYRDVPDVWVEM